MNNGLRRPTVMTRKVHVYAQGKRVKMARNGGQNMRKITCVDLRENLEDIN